MRSANASRSMRKTLTLTMASRSRHCVSGNTKRRRNTRCVRYRCSTFFRGRIFTFTPAMSLFVECRSDAELATLFERLSEGGEVLMPLDQYPFSRRYGWVSDKFGVSWQLNLP